MDLSQYRLEAEVQRHVLLISDWSLDSINWRGITWVTDVIFNSQSRICCNLIIQITGKDVERNGCDLTHNNILPWTWENGKRQSVKADCKAATCIANLLNSKQQSYRSRKDSTSLWTALKQLITASVVQFCERDYELQDCIRTDKSSFEQTWSFGNRRSNNAFVTIFKTNNTRSTQPIFSFSYSKVCTSYTKAESLNFW
jgi:hypothetical protein